MPKYLVAFDEALTDRAEVEARDAWDAAYLAGNGLLVRLRAGYGRWVRVEALAGLAPRCPSRIAIAGSWAPLTAKMWPSFRPVRSDSRTPSGHSTYRRVTNGFADNPPRSVVPSLRVPLVTLASHQHADLSRESAPLMCAERCRGFGFRPCRGCKPEGTEHRLIRCQAGWDDAGPD